MIERLSLEDLPGDGECTHLIMVVLVQDPASAGIHLLVALSTHAQRGVHVHVMTCQVEGDESLEEDRPARPGGAQEHKETRGRAPIRDHVEDGAERRRLFEIPCRVSVECVQQARDAVEQGTCPRVQRHVIERGDREEDP